MKNFNRLDYKKEIIKILIPFWIIICLIWNLIWDIYQVIYWLFTPRKRG